MRYLVLVDTPTKCAKIAEYLNDAEFDIYDVVCTMGSLVELSSIDVANKFKCTYSVRSENQSIVNLITQKIRKSDIIVLAFDDDIAGEELCSSMCKVFKLDVNITRRVIYREITRNEILTAFKHPKFIDKCMVRAHHTRQMLDILVGYKTSVALYCCFKQLYTNRIQSFPIDRNAMIALHLIYDNRVDIIDALRQETRKFKTQGVFTNKNILFELDTQFSSETDVRVFLEDSIHHNHIYTCTAPYTKVIEPPTPFNTIALQCAAYQLFGISPDETMHLCQQLYEEGLITYMRTDSTSYNKGFITEVKRYMHDTHSTNESTSGAVLVRDNFANTTDVQHEAIRPTNVFITTDRAVNTRILFSHCHKSQNIYKLIWTNAIESCLCPAIKLCVTATIQGARNTKYIYTSEIYRTLGWKTITASRHYTVTDSASVNFQYLQLMGQNQLLTVKKIVSVETQCEIPPRYSIASLLRKMDELWIGRPYMGARLVETLQEHGYITTGHATGVAGEFTEIVMTYPENIITNTTVVRNRGEDSDKLILTPTGMYVHDTVEKHFGRIFNYEHAWSSEYIIENIASGVILDNKDVCISHNNILNELIIDCCPELPVVTVVHNNVLKHKGSVTIGQYQDGDVVVKRYKFGTHVLWKGNTYGLHGVENRPLETILLPDIVHLFTTPSTTIVRQISPNYSIRTNKYGEDYFFYKTSRMKTPLFYSVKDFVTDTGFDYKTCDIDTINRWLINNHKK